MAEYIEREALKAEFEEDGHLSAYIEDMINSIPAADHGRLVDADALFGCEYGEPRTNTNYDRFIRKTPEELAEFFAQQGYKKPVFYDEWLPLCNYVMGAKICHENGCKDCWLDWLLSPAKEGE